ncbi:hypothetical protein C2S52_020755 [Perilla frutescens var. hirtella]|nr:hypothetical protein C2S52_020755 [Perilla frutescens var. hirtella]
MVVFQGRMNTHRERGPAGFKMIGGEHHKDNLTLPKGFRELVSKISLPDNIVLIDKCQKKWPVTVEVAESLLSKWEMLVFECVDLYVWHVTLYNCDYIEREVVRQRMRHSPAPNIGKSFTGILVGPTESGEIHVWVCVDRNPLIRDKDALQLQGTWSDRVWHVRIRFRVSGMLMGDGWAEFANENEIKQYDLLVLNPTDDGDTLSVSVFTAQGMRRRVLPEVNVKNNPTMKFQKLMKKHSINILDIPIEWVRATGLEPPLELFMTNGNGRRWCVAVEGRRNNYGKRYRFEPAGWRAFYVDNGLCVGDLVKFESRGANWQVDDGGFYPGTRIRGLLRLWIRVINLSFNTMKYKDSPCELIRQQLTHDNFERLSRSCFGNIVKTPSMHLQDGLYFQLLLILDRDLCARNTLGFKLRERVFEMGPQDFALVTGLRFSPVPLARSISAFYNIVFCGRPDIQKEEFIKGCTTRGGGGEYCYKLALLYLIYSVIVCPNRHSPLIDVNYIHVVDDLEAFKNYP